MESEVTLNERRDSLMHEHYSSWNFKKSCLTFSSFKTTVFSPIPNFDVSFYFELLCNQFVKDGEKKCAFKINFVKSRGINTPLSMKMNLRVTINFSADNQVFRKYDQDDIIVENMSIVTIANDIFDQYFRHDYYNKLSPFFNKDFVLTCQLLFYNHLSSPEIYYKDMRSLKILNQFANDFSCLYQHSQPSPSKARNQLNDVEIKIGEETFFSHKTILAAHSPVFLNMFNHDCLETKTNAINISDFSAKFFKSFLKYLYSGEIEDQTWPTVKELYALADKYDVRTLKRECAEISATFLSVDTVCEILQMAYDYEDDHLKFVGKKFAFQHIQELLSSSDWKEMIQHNSLIGYEVMICSQIGLNRI